MRDELRGSGGVRKGVGGGVREPSEMVRESGGSGGVRPWTRWSGVGSELSNTLMFPNTRRLCPYKTEEA